MRVVVSLVAGALLAGCSVHSAAVYPAEPELVYLEDDVYVVADYPEPVFFSAGMYWRYDAGYWYRSRVHTGNWSRVERVPTVIRRIDRPQTYVRYRPGHRAGSPMTRRDDDRSIREDRQRERERAREQRKEQREREQEMRQEQREHEQELRRQERERDREQRDKDKARGRDDRDDKRDRDDRPDKGNKKDRAGDD